jgi:hypothetical protein
MVQSDHELTLVKLTCQLLYRPNVFASSIMTSCSAIDHRFNGFDLKTRHLFAAIAAWQPVPSQTTPCVTLLSSLLACLVLHYCNYSPRPAFPAFFPLAQISARSPLVRCERKILVVLPSPVSSADQPTLHIIPCGNQCNEQEYFRKSKPQCGGSK